MRSFELIQCSVVMTSVAESITELIFHVMVMWMFIKSRGTFLIKKRHIWRSARGTHKISIDPSSYHLWCLKKTWLSGNLNSQNFLWIPKPGSLNDKAKQILVVHTGMLRLFYLSANYPKSESVVVSFSRVELKTILIAIAIIVLGEPSYSFNEPWAVAK